MSTSAPQIAIGTVHGDHTEVEDALFALTGQKTAHIPVFALAGPNEVLQVLADIAAWKLLGTTVVGIYCTGIVSEAGKATWRAMASKIEKVPAALEAKFMPLVSALQKEQERGQSVSIGLIEPMFDGQGRRDRVYLTDLSPEEVARHIYIFSHCVQPVSSWLSEVYSAHKGNVFVDMRITDEGTLIVELEPAFGMSLPSGISKRVFDAQGKIIEETRIP